ncbi:hypothetical protein ACOMCU_00810 [Lysinibacillus sp. UGB7]|uniref:hypothetical protein n=1 Tax=Lysinibacillus sp. UGB7 TaxID=3411039 RepID=UPI003B7C4081
MSWIGVKGKDFLDKYWDIAAQKGCSCETDKHFSQDYLGSVRCDRCDTLVLSQEEIDLTEKRKKDAAKYGPVALKKTDSKEALDIVSMFTSDISSGLSDEDSSMIVSELDLKRMDVLKQTIRGLESDYERLYYKIVAVMLLRAQEINKDAFSTDFIMKVLDAITRSERTQEVSQELHFVQMQQEHQRLKDALEEIYSLPHDKKLVDAKYIAGLSLNKGG